VISCFEAYHCRWSTAWLGGDVAAALDNSRIGIETYDMARHRHLGQAFGGHDPGVCAHACRTAEVEDVCQRAAEIGAGVGFYLPENHRLRGECLLSLSRRNKANARQAFMTARDVARLQGAMLFELRAKTGLVEMGR
jgi:hypothetical protein